jgi:hypothetical protein
VIREGDDLRLCEVYEQAIKRSRNDKRNNNEPVNEPVKVSLVHLMQIIENKDIKEINRIKYLIDDTINEPVNSWGGTIKLTADSISEKLLLLIATVANHPGMRRPELCKSLNIKLSTIKRILNSSSDLPKSLINILFPSITL